MGVKGLWALVEPAGRPVNVDTLGGKVLAVDASIWLYQLTKATRDKEGNVIYNAHIMGFVRRICKLLYYNIKPIFVFDGGAPALKRNTLAERRRRREQVEVDLNKTAAKLLETQIKLSTFPSTKDSSRKKSESKASEWARKRRKIDQYALPPMPPNHDRDAAKDPRLPLLPEELADWDSDQVKKILDSLNSDAFKSMSLEDQHRIILDLRLQSRHGSERRLQRMVANSETPLDFSKSQINNLVHRNNITQKWIDVLGMDEVMAPKRVAADRLKQYMLVKKDDAAGGWSMQLGPNGPSITQAPSLGPKSQSPTAETESDEDIAFEQVPTQAPVKQVSVVVIDSSDEGDLQSIKDWTHDDEYAEILQAQLNSLDAVRKNEEPVVPTRTQAYEAFFECWTGIVPAKVLASFPRALEDMREQLFDLEKADAEESIQDLKQYGDKGPEVQEAVAFIQSYLEAVIEFKSTRERSEAEWAAAKALPPTEVDPIPEKVPVPDPIPPTSAPEGMNLSSDTSVIDLCTPEGSATPLLCPQEIATTVPHIDTSIVESGSVPSEEMKDLGVKVLESSSSASVMSSQAKPIDVIPENAKDIELELFGPSSSEEERWTFSARPSRTEPFRSSLKTSQLPSFVGHPKGDHVISQPHKAQPSFGKEQRRSLTSTSSDSEEEVLLGTGGVKPKPVLAKPARSLRSKKKPQKTALELELFGDSDDDDLGTVAQGVVESSMVRKPKDVSVTLIPSDEEVADSALVEVSNANNSKQHAVNRPEDGFIRENVIPNGNVAKRRTSSMRNLSVLDPVASRVDENPMASGPEWKNPTGSLELTNESADTVIVDHQQADTALDFLEPEDFTYYTSDEELDKRPRQNAAGHVEDYRDLSDGEPSVVEEPSDQDRAELEIELARLKEAQRKAKRDASEVTPDMVEDVKQLLGLFGVPLITARMEAEAQCAYLAQKKIVQGIVTDDSDVFLFGGDRIYKNMFHASKVVELYDMVDIERQMRLDRPKLINLAQLLGSDYAVGIKGIGSVTAMDIISEFPGENGLFEFRELLQKPMALNGWSPKLLKLWKLRRRVEMPASFPDSQVLAAYYHPSVEEVEKTSDFQWGEVDMPNLSAFLRIKLGWTSSKVEDIMQPVLKHRAANKATAHQTTLEKFFKGSGKPAAVPAVLANGIRRVVSEMAALEQASSDGIEAPSNSQPARASRGRGGSKITRTTSSDRKAQVNRARRGRGRGIKLPKSASMPSQKSLESFRRGTNM